MSEHLGGWDPGDPQGYTPQLWTWLVDQFKVRTMLDVGAGEGRAMRHFAELGCATVGIDGLPSPGVYRWDFTDGPAPLPLKEFDLCWSCEFVEHVEEKHASNFLQTFARARVLAMTHAVPGQPGHHHVNCRDQDYWRSRLSARFRLAENLTDEARHLAAKEHPESYFAKTGMILLHT